MKFLLFILFISCIIYVSAFDLPDDLKIPDENEDYKIKIANYYLKCINKYINCDLEQPFSCDNYLLSCFYKKTEKHVKIITTNYPSNKGNKIVIEEEIEDDP